MFPHAPPPLATYLARFRTADEVADACRAAGVRGVPNRCDTCAFARLLTRAGYRNVSVDESDLRASGQWLVQPGPVNSFVKGFDAGWYPDLVESAHASR